MTAPLRPGSPAPGFTLADDRGTSVSLADFAGQWVVLYFYPRDNTPTCTRQACALRDAWEALQRLGVAVVGISPDSPARHAGFRRRFQLPFVLLSDPDHAVADRYGAWGPKIMFGVRYEGILRTTFVIDDQGRVREIFARVRAGGHGDAVLAALERHIASTERMS